VVPLGLRRKGQPGPAFHGPAHQTDRLIQIDGPGQPGGRVRCLRPPVEKAKLHVATLTIRRRPKQGVQNLHCIVRDCNDHERVPVGHLVAEQKAVRRRKQRAAVPGFAQATEEVASARCVHVQPRCAHTRARFTNHSRNVRATRPWPAGAPGTESSQRFRSPHRLPEQTHKGCRGIGGAVIGSRALTNEHVSASWLSP
jgi:hypothetical protein